MVRVARLLLALMTNRSCLHGHVAAFVNLSPLSARVRDATTRSNTAHAATVQPEEESKVTHMIAGGTGNKMSATSRRQMFGSVIRAASAACVSCCMHPYSAHALAAIATPPPELIATYDVSRSLIKDSMFAAGMASGMVRYEREAYPKKKLLFEKLFTSLQSSNGNEPTIVEVGMGSFPNAIFYEGHRGLDIIGVDPNDRMAGYARDSASKSGLLKRYGDSLRIVHGVSEALPFEDNTIDAVVCSLTLCSVIDPARSVAEIKRVLKRNGGQFLFWEHVLSQTDPAFAAFQIERTPIQIKNADGCHLDRNTGDTIKAAGFRKVDLEYLELEDANYIKPTVCGIAYT